ncbi:DUF1707 domain-containing protein [Actinoplanes sp. NPDC051861]|uniref:DUF1707 SHOCT-like domain-containing protein n=1 Tax=Actinoplanes sp. NPDC051861 TaxID=3155170 RepID=UPI00343E8C43
MGIPVPARPSDGDRERVAELLQQACGEGRLTLEEFSVRVGAVWSAESESELALVTRDIAPTPVVGSARTVEKIVTVFSQTKRRGRWRLRSRRLGTYTVFGSTKIDLRDVATAEDVIEINGCCVFGELKIIVPQGVEVEVTGVVALSSQETRLAAVPRLPGTPEIRVRVTTWFSNLEIRSRPPSLEPAIQDD